MPILTADGSHTLFSPRTGEHYHSTHGAKQESTHIFIEAGLRTFAATSLKRPITLFEVGFGTGLNALLALKESLQSDLPIQYYTIEKFPIDSTTARQLNYCTNEREQKLFNRLHDLPWNQPLTTLTPHFHFSKTAADFTQTPPPTGIDVLFFDAFSPESEPTLWTLPLFQNLYRAMNPNGLITTYCAKGTVRRMLLEAGFTVERLAGPPGKREILRGRKNE